MIFVEDKATAEKRNEKDFVGKKNTTSCLVLSLKE